MALHPEFPKSPYVELLPDQRWFPAAEELRSTAYEKLLPALVAKIRNEVSAWRDAAKAASLKNGKSEVVCEQGQLTKVSNDKDGVITRNTLTKHWAVDFDYMSRKEIIKVAVETDASSPPPPSPACGRGGPEAGRGRVRRALDRQLHLRKRMAKLPHLQKPRPGIQLRTPHLHKSGPLHRHRHLR